MSVSENQPTTEIEIPELTDEQIDVITARRLDSLRDADWVPYPIYRAMAFMAVRFTVELALVKPSKDGVTEVLLTQRPADDEDIPNQWHIPGVGVKQKDPVLHYHDNNAALGRIMTDEVGGDLQIADHPIMLDTVRRVGGGRTEVTSQYWAKVLGGNQEYGQFFNMDAVLQEPPDGGLVTTHDATIRRVADHYQLLRADG
jgi:hypothetical protein